MLRFVVVASAFITDMALDMMRECGTEPFYRLGRRSKAA